MGDDASLHFRRARGRDAYFVQGLPISARHHQLVGRPRVIAADKLGSFAAASNELGPNVEHRQHKGLNNQAENSHQPTWVREKVMHRIRKWQFDLRSLGPKIPLRPAAWGAALVNR